MFPELFILNGPGNEVLIYTDFELYACWFRGPLDLDIRYLVKHSSGYTFQFSRVTRTARRGKPRTPIKYCVFQDNKNLCVCHHIDLYLDRSKDWRNNEQQLLLSFVNPHKAVSTSTLSRWIVEVLKYSQALILQHLKVIPPGQLLPQKQRPLEFPQVKY